jgi:hypothetical protein
LEYVKEEIELKMKKLFGMVVMLVMAAALLAPTASALVVCRERAGGDLECAEVTGAFDLEASSGDGGDSGNAGRGGRGGDAEAEAEVEAVD